MGASENKHTQLFNQKELLYIIHADKICTLINKCTAHNGVEFHSENKCQFTVRYAIHITYYLWQTSSMKQKWCVMQKCSVISHVSQKTGFHCWKKQSEIKLLFFCNFWATSSRRSRCHFGFKTKQDFQSQKEKKEKRRAKLTSVPNLAHFFTFSHSGHEVQFFCASFSLSLCSPPPLFFRAHREG